MKEIKLTRGMVAIVDDEDFEYLNQFKWHANKIWHTYYAIRSEWNHGDRVVFLMHRMILGLQKGDKRQVDHKDHNGLNNQRSNIRVCTGSQNLTNRRSGKFNGVASKYKGVSVKVNEQGGKYYRCQLRINGKYISKLFPFTPEGERHAALGYNELAKKHYGEFAHLNILSDD